MDLCFCALVGVLCALFTLYLFAVFYPMRGNLSEPDHDDDLTDPDDPTAAERRRARAALMRLLRRNGDGE